MLRAALLSCLNATGGPAAEWGWVWPPELSESVPWSPPGLPRRCPADRRALIPPRPVSHYLSKLMIFCPVCSPCPGGPADSFIRNGCGRRLSVRQSCWACVIADLMPLGHLLPLPPTTRGTARRRIECFPLHELRPRTRPSWVWAQGQPLRPEAPKMVHPPWIPLGEKETRSQWGG